MEYIVCVSGIYIGGGSYSSVYVLQPVCIFMVHMVYTCIPMQCLFVVCIFILSISISLYTCIPNISLYQLCGIYPQLDEYCLGCMHMCYFIYS